MVKRREKGTILIVDDEVQILDFSSRALELEGYHVLKARDADQAVRVSRENRIGLILLDLRLPGRDGWSVLNEIVSNRESSSIPVVVYTASAGAAEREKAITMGATDYLVKPLSVAALKQTVDHVLSRRR